MRRPRPVRRWRDERGITAIIVALMLTVILMFVAVAIDGGQAFVSHRTSQNASDAGAFAGTGALDHLLFDPTCTPTITPSCPYTSTSAIAQKAIDAATGSGADASTMHCYLVDYQGTRVADPGAGTTPDLCAGGVAAAASSGELSLASGVETDATVARQTYFANIVSSSFNHTTAGTHATAVIQNFVGGTASPFVVCGSTTNPSDYDILTQAPDGTYTVKPTAMDKFYVLESSHTPVCGAGSSGFKGQAGSAPLVLNQLNGVGTGNGNSGNVTAQLVGTTACTPAQIAALSFDGCGVLIPIATYAQGTGAGTQAYLVAWTVWNVWGDGKGSYNFNVVPTNPPPAGAGNSCKSPLLGNDGSGGNGASTSAMKYCGQLLGSYTVVAGGAGGGPPIAGEARVFHLVS